MIKGLVHPYYKNRKREQKLFSLQNRVLQEDLIAAFQYIKENHKENGERPFLKTVVIG